MPKTNSAILSQIPARASQRAPWTCFVLAALFLSTPAIATILRVPADHPGVQSAIDAASATDTILVDPGTYVERITFRGLGIVLGSLFLVTGDTLYVASTILDGDSAGTVVTFSSNEDSTARIVGFTIRNGAANSGAGIACRSSSPTIASNHITANHASPTTFTGGLGGGIYCSSSSAVIRGNRIVGNSATGDAGTGFGGGIYCEFSSPRVLDNVVAENLCREAGGGIYCSQSAPVLMGNTITGNRTGTFFDTGGGIQLTTCTGVVQSNTVTGNIATSGGGIHCGGGAPLIGNNVVADNRIVGEGAIAGGGILCSNTAAIVRQNIIRDNRAGYGGGVAIRFGATASVEDNAITGNYAGTMGGGVHSEESSPTLVGNLVKGNTTNLSSLGMGGGIAIDQGSPLVAANRIIANSAVFGGGIRCVGSLATIRNCVISQNSGQDGGGLQCPFGSAPAVVHSILWANTALNSPEIAGSPRVMYSIVAGASGAQPDVFDADPLFVDAFNDDYNMCAQSPCIDAGHPDSLDTDLTRADIGVFHAQHPECFLGRAFHVSSSGDDDTGDGSAQLPFRSIQVAIDRARHGDTVWVAPGTYPGNLQMVAKNIVLSSRLVEDEIEVEDTVLDGQASGAALTTALCKQGALIRGFTIRNGDPGGIRCRFYARPRIEDNLVLENMGSGIACDYSNPTLRRNVIRSNVALNGGGVYCRFSAPVIETCRIEGNRASNGGGIYCGVLSPVISGSVIDGNTAGSAGGGIYTGGGSPRIDSTVISRNVAGGAEVAGGGLYCSGGSPVLTNCTIVGNSVAGAFTYGSALFCNNSAARLEQCIVAFCSSAHPLGGTIDCVGEREPRLVCTDVFENQGPYGCIVSQLNSNGNATADPAFCNRDAADYRLDEHSPCLPANNECGVLLGARGEGCGDTAVLFSLVGAESGVGWVRVSWNVRGGGSTPAVVWHLAEGEAWERLMEIIPDARGAVDFEDPDVPPGRHAYRLAISSDGAEALSEEVWVLVPEFDRLEIGGVVLETAAWRVSIQLPRPGDADLRIVDVLGRIVASRRLGFLGAGVHQVRFPLERTAPSGAYFVRLSQGGAATTRKALVVR